MKKLELFNKYIYMFIICLTLILFLRIIFKIDYQLLFIIFFLLCPLVNYFNSKLIKGFNKKALITTITFSLIFTLSIMPFYSTPKEDITISSINSEVRNNENNSLQINEIKSGPYSLNFNNIKDLNKWKKVNNYVVRVLNENEKATISVLANQKLNITYFAIPDNSPVNITVNGKTKKQELENPKYRLRTFDYGKVKTNYPVWKQIIRVFIVFVGMIIINLYLLCIVRKTKKLFFIIPMTSYLLLAYFLQMSTFANISFILIIVFSSFLCVKFYESDYLKKYFDNKGKKIGFIILTFILTFMLTGKYIFLSSAIPVDITFTGILFFIFIMFYLTVFEFGCFYLIEHFSKKINKKKTSNEKKKNNKIFFLITFLILSITWLIWGFIYYPGNISVDTAVQWIQATNGEITNFHPYWSTLILRYVYLIFGNIFMMVVIQTVLFALMISGLFTYLYKRGFSSKFLIIFTIILALLPNIAMLNITIWKDITFTLAFLALTFWCYKVYVQEKTNKIKILDLVILCILLLLASNLRYNAIFILYLVSLYFIIFGIIRKNYKLIITFILIIIINLGLNQLIIKCYKIEMQDLGGLKYASVIKNFIGTMYYDGDLSEEAHNKIEKLNTDEDFLTAYSTFNIDNIYFAVDNGVNNWWPIINKYEFSEIVPLYIENIVKNPGVFLRDKLDGMNILWSIPLPIEDFIFTAYEGIASNISSEEQKIILSQSKTKYTSSVEYNNLSGNLRLKYFREIINFSNSNNLLPILWKSGILLLVLFIAIYYAIINKKREIWAMTMPIIAYTLSWCISLNHPSFRYVYYLYLGSVLILFLSMLNIDKKKKEQNK